MEVGAAVRIQVAIRAPGISFSVQRKLCFEIMIVFFSDVSNSFFLTFYFLTKSRWWQALQI